LLAVIMQVYVEGVSTRSVDDVVKAVGIDSGMSKSQVSRSCAELDEQLNAFRERPLDHTGFPYLFLDATYVKVRATGRVVSKAVIIGTGVTATGDREILGTAVGDSEDEALWTEFLCSLRRRGLAGVRLVISDAHLGLKAAITKVLQGCSWQRCRVHFMRNLLARVPKGSAEMVAATVRTIFRSTRPARGSRAAGQGRRHARPSVPRGPDAAARGRRGAHGVRGVPACALAQDLVDQSAGAAQPAGQASDQCRGHPSR
jgi:putative transposase